MDEASVPCTCGNPTVQASAVPLENVNSDKDPYSALQIIKAACIRWACKEFPGRNRRLGQFVKYCEFHQSRTSLRTDTVISGQITRGHLSNITITMMMIDMLLQKARFSEGDSVVWRRVKHKMQEREIVYQ